MIEIHGVVIIHLATEPIDVNEIARESKKEKRLRRTLWRR